MMRECSGCGRFSCSGECYLECEADYAEEEATISTLTLDDLRKMYGSQLTEVHGDPLGDAFQARAVAASRSRRVSPSHPAGLPSLSQRKSA